MFTIMFQDVPFGRLVAKDDFNFWYSRPDTKSRYFEINYENFLAHEDRHPQCAQDLLFAGLNPDPSARIGIEDVMASEWITTAPSALDEALHTEITEILNLKPHPKME